MREFIDSEHPIEDNYYKIMDRYTGKNAHYIISKLRKLIDLDPYFFDAYTSLVDMCYSIEDFHKGDTIIKQASERALKKIVDRKGVWPDRLEWGWLENRHIIRAILNQAILSWKGEIFNEALDLLRKLLRSNPNDNIGARFYILGIRMNISFIDFELRFSGYGFYDKDILEWFNFNYKSYPDEFEWWDKEMEKYETQDEEVDMKEIGGDDEMVFFTIDNIYEKFDTSEEIKYIFENFDVKNQPNKRDTPSPSGDSHKPKIFQLKISIKDTKPPIWRRILISNQVTFHDLHLAIQEFFNWGNYHLHEFNFLHDRYTMQKIRLLGLDSDGKIPDDLDDNFLSFYDAYEDKVKLYDAFSKHRKTVGYLYDFGDNWEHSIKIEKRFPFKKGFKEPLCVGGKRAAPPEDCGGTWGYKRLLKIISNPNHSEYKEMIDWLGGKFDPNKMGINMNKMTPNQIEKKYGSSTNNDTTRENEREELEEDIKGRNFNHIFKAFITYRSNHLKESSLKMYENVIGLLEAYLNRYGFNYLTDEENDKFEEKAKKESKLTFSNFFGTDFLDRFGLTEFLDYFVPHKVIGSKMTFKSIPRVLRSFIKWLHKKGGIAKVDCENHLDIIKDFEEYNLE